MAEANNEAKLSRRIECNGRELKRFSEDHLVLGIELVVEVVVVRVEPQTVVVAIHVEDPVDPVRVGIMRRATFVTALRFILSGLYRIRHLIQ